MNFEIVSRATDSRARLGRLVTAHGVVDTPAFMPVATQATVKGLTSADLKSLGVQMLIANTYHLALRPGAEQIAELGGLHKFMNWRGPILTDSGAPGCMAGASMYPARRAKVRFFTSAFPSVPDRDPNLPLDF